MTSSLPLPPSDPPSDIRDLLSTIATLWDPSVEKVDKRSPIYVAVTKHAREVLKRILGESPRLDAEGSTGRGRQTYAPWVRVFDPMESPSATSGRYVVYLFSVDMRRVYLSLGFGVTEFETALGSGDPYRAELQALASKFRTSLGERRLSGFLQGPLDLGATRGSLHEGYELCAVASYAYDLTALPSAQDLEDDLLQMVGLYQSLLSDPAIPALDELVESSAMPARDQTVEVVGFAPRARKIAARPGARTARQRRSDASVETRKIGEHGEKLVIREEKRRLVDGGRADLADDVDHPADRNEYPGYDIKSFEVDGSPRYIEVKSSLAEKGAYFVSRNEWDAAKKHGEQYWLYVVPKIFKKHVVIKAIQDPVQRAADGDIAIEVERFVVHL